MLIKKLQKLQTQWASQIQINENFSGEYFLSKPILALDIQYDGETAYLGGVLRLPTSPETFLNFTANSEAGLKYVSGLFCFREGPPLLAFVRNILAQAFMPHPSLLIIDGHGIAHPQGLGLASWLGLHTGIVSLGCAKRSLLPFNGELGVERGATLPIFRQGKQVGEVLRTRDLVKPLFISSGHLIGLSAGREVILGLSGDYRLPDLLRRADQIARTYARKAVFEEAVTDLGYCAPDFIIRH